MARLVESAAAQVDVIGSDAGAGGLTRPDQAEDEEFARQVASVVDEQVRPALAAYRDRLRAECCPPRDDDHPGLCHLPDGEHMYELLARHHTSMAYTPECCTPWASRSSSPCTTNSETSVHGSGA